MAANGRMKFSPDDDKNLLIFLIQQLKQGNETAKTPFGLKLWKRAEVEKITTHPHQSMWGRFTKKLWPQIDSFGVSITPEEIEYLKNQLQACGYAPSPAPKKRESDQPKATMNKKKKPKSREVITESDDDSDQNDESKSAEDGKDEQMETEDGESAAEQDNEDKMVEIGNISKKIVNTRNDDAIETNVSAASVRENVENVAAAESCTAQWTQPLTQPRFENDKPPTQDSDGESSEESDSDKENENGNDGLQPGISRNQQIRKRRKKFTTEDDISILKFLADEISQHNPDGDTLGGNKIWELAAEKCITSHSGQSMKKRYQSKLKNLDDLDYVPDEIKSYLSKRLAMMKMPPVTKLRAPVKKSTKSAAIDSMGESTTHPKEPQLINQIDRSQEIAADGQPQDPLTIVSPAEVHSVVFEMYRSGCLNSDRLGDFTDKVDRLLNLANAHKVPFIEVLRTVESMEAKKMGELEQIFKK